MASGNQQQIEASILSEEMMESPIVEIIRRGDMIDTELFPTRFSVPNSRRTVTVWANDHKFQVLEADISSILKIDRFPKIVVDKIMAIQTSGDIDYCYAMDKLYQPSRNEIMFLESALDVPFILKSTVMAAFPNDYPRKELAYFSAGFSALVTIGSKFRGIVMENVDHTFVTKSVWLKHFGLSDSGACSHSTAINMALMTLCVIAKSVNDRDCEEFQREVFNACTQDAGLALSEPAFLKLDFMVTMNRIWPNYQNFISPFMTDLFFVCKTDRMSKLELAIARQVQKVMKLNPGEIITKPRRFGIFTQDC